MVVSGWMFCFVVCFFNQVNPTKSWENGGYFLYFSNQTWSLRQYELQSNNSALALSLKHLLITTLLDILDQLSGHSSSASMGGGNHDLQLLSQLSLMSTKDAESSNPAGTNVSHEEAGKSFHSKVNSTVLQQSPNSQSRAATELTWCHSMIWMSEQSKVYRVWYPSL